MFPCPFLHFYISPFLLLHLHLRTFPITVVFPSHALMAIGSGHPHDDLFADRTLLWFDILLVYFEDIAFKAFAVEKPNTWSATSRLG